METVTPIRVTLREKRKAAGMTQVELAAKSGVFQATISEIENREAGGRIDLDVLDKLCAALNLEPGELLERTPRRQKQPPKRKRG